MKPEGGHAWGGAGEGDDDDDGLARQVVGAWIQLLQ